MTGRILGLILLLPAALHAARMGEPRLVGEAPLTDWYISASGEVLLSTPPAAPTVNVWQLAASRWIDALGIVLLIASLLGLWTVRRLWGQRGRVGQVHCVSCDYDLRGCASPRCPECGEDLIQKPGAVAWPVGGRIAVRFIAIALAAGLWAPLWWLADPFRSWNGPEWFSDDIHDWATRKNVGWVLNRVVSTRTVDRIGVKTGKRLCTISRSTHPMPHYWPAQPLWDTRFAMVMFEKHIDIRYTDDGRLHRRFTLPDPDMRIEDANETQSGVLCVTTNRAQILRWRWRDGATLAPLPRDRRASFGWWLGDGGQKLISLNDSKRGVIDADGTLREFDPPPHPNCYGSEWLSIDRQRLLRLFHPPVVEVYSNGSSSPAVVSPSPPESDTVEIWDVASGKLVREIAVGHNADEVAIDWRNELLFVTRREAPSARIEAYDARTGEAKGSLDLPGTGRLSNLLVPQRDTRLVVTTEPAGGSGMQVWEVPIVYDD